MSNPLPETASAAARDPRGRSRRLGPYETAYEVRRGYDDPGDAAAPVPAATPEPVWIGRRRDR